MGGDTTYQVLHWARVHPGDLSDEELTWHGITSDIDPSTGAVAYSRGGAPVNPDTIRRAPSQHRTPSPHPRERTQEPGPHSCPLAPGLDIPAACRRQRRMGLRTDRAKRMIETHRRREVLFQRAPTADPQWAEAIIAADPLWGPDEDWKLLIDQTTTKPIRRPLATPDQVDEREPTHAPAPPRPARADSIAEKTKPNSRHSKPICRTSSARKQS